MGPEHPFSAGRTVFLKRVLGLHVLRTLRSILLGERFWPLTGAIYR
jgi:hypothetical protein